MAAVRGSEGTSHGASGRYCTVGGRTWRHLGSFSVTRAHLVSLGITWCHSVSLGLGVTSLGVTRCHLVSLGVTRFHLVSLGFTSASLGYTWCHLVSLGDTFVSLGFARCHLVSRKPGSRRFSGLFPHDLCSLGCTPPVGRSIFSPFREKKTAWRHLDTFFCQKTGFPGSCRSKCDFGMCHISIVS